jgi:hypothetical protein
LGQTEQIALHFGAAERAQQFLLLLRLGALRGRRHVACGCDTHDRLDNRGRAIRLYQVVHEAAVDLDLVERKALQIAQRRSG